MTELIPHGMCFLWQRDLLLLHILSDGILAAAYLSIPAAAMFYARRRTDLEFARLPWVFLGFLAACGITHLFAIWVIWNPDYWLQGVAKAITAILSVSAALVLWPLIPRLLSVPSAETRRGGQERAKTADHPTLQLQRLNAELEQRVADRTQELEDSNAELERFAYHASHDLKAPLRAVSQLSQWIELDLSTQTNQEVSGHLELMRSRIALMERMLDDLLEYSRVGTVYDARFEEPIDGNVLLADVLMLLSPPPEFAVDIDASVSRLRVMRMPLQQILLNLIGNALKHHDKSEGRIAVDVRETHEHYAIRVSDDGPGIAAKFHDSVFEMFRTLRPKDEVEASGVGLAIVRKAVERFGGRIEVESSPGRGAAFTVIWPKQGKS